jgi:hypothetical protein
MKVVAKANAMTAAPTHCVIPSEAAESRDLREAICLNAHHLWCATRSAFP